jgi:hypothetical protein
MRGPDAEAAGNRGNAQPNGLMCRVAGVAKKINSCQARKDTDGGGKKDKPDIVLIDDTIVYCQHTFVPCFEFFSWITLLFVILSLT